MKATKNQANAVRSYLATLGLEISHVQALEVIARGEGHRSRHVKPTGASKANAALTPLLDNDAFSKALALQAQYCAPARNFDLADTTEQLMAAFPELFDSSLAAASFLEEGDDESIPLYCAELSLAFAIRSGYMAGARKPADLAAALRELVTHCYSIVKDYRSAYWFLTEGSPASPAVPLQTVQVIERPASSTEAVEAVGSVAESRANAIRSSYWDSGCQRSDLVEAVENLLRTCPELFAGEESAIAFLMEADATSAGTTYLLQVHSVDYGYETFPYDSEEDRSAGLLRLMAKAVELDDKLGRGYYFSEVDSALERDSAEYDAALADANLVAEVTYDGRVFYQDKFVGTITELTAAGVPLSSKIERL